MTYPAPVSFTLIAIPVNQFIAPLASLAKQAKYIVPGLGDFGDRYFGTD